MKKIFLIGVTLLAWYCSAQQAHAQIWGGEAERYFRPGAYAYNDGAPFSHQYGYSTNSPSAYLSFGQSGSHLAYLDYADRLERAYKFGYAIPQDPSTRPVARPRIGFGLGLGYFFRR